MQKHIIFISLLFLSSVCVNTSAEETVNIHVRVDGFRNSKGICYLLLFRDKKGFPDSNGQAEVVLQEAITGNSAEFRFVTHKGKGAISVLHDENLNKKMDKRWYGKPVEGFGASNNPKAVYGPPGFDESLINLEKEDNYIQIKLNYIED